MLQKTETQVVIGNKVITLAGSESAEYQQKIASYINEKLDELNKMDGFRFQSIDNRALLTEINIADDVLKAREKIASLEQELQDRNQEITDLKHELISSQMKLDSASNQIEELQKTISSKSQDIVRLETQLKAKS